MSKSDHKKEIVCLRCGFKCDAIYKSQYFGIIQSSKPQVCNKCKEELKEEGLKAKQRAFGNAVINRPDTKQTAPRLSKNSQALFNAQHAFEDRKLERELKDFIGL